VEVIAMNDAALLDVPGPGQPLVEEIPLFEVIDGQRVDLPPMSAYARQIANRLVKRIVLFTAPRDLGEGLTEALFELPAPVNRNRRPDGAFLSYQRWAKDRKCPYDEDAWPVVPELAIEVVSPWDLAVDLHQKIAEYFQAGVQLVWVVYPKAETVVVFESPDTSRELKRTEILDGGTVLPEFQLPLKDLFLD